MKIIAIDTSQTFCSVALAEDGRIIALQTDNEPSRQAERLFLIIGQMLQQNNLAYSDIELVAANVGPGSFTGVRIGLAAARGIALAAKIPIMGISGFEALEYAARVGTSFKNHLVVFDAKRNQVFTKFFINSFSQKEYLLEYNDIEAVIGDKNNFEVVGDGASLIKDSLQQMNLQYSINDKLQLPDAAMIALTAFYKIAAGQLDNNPSPLYIRPPDAKLPGGKNIGQA